MSVLMLVALATGVSPMPKPIPAAIVGQFLGEGAPKPLIMVLAAIAHLGYGGVWGAVLAASTRPVTIWKGVGLGLSAEQALGPSYLSKKISALSLS